MQETSNKKLKKIELTDAPPDITVINPNWDTIDTELQNGTNHQADSSIHVTSTDKSNWNGKAAGSHTHGTGDITSGTLTVSRGGTGRGSHTSGYFLRGNGSGAVTLSSPSTVLSDIGAAPNVSTFKNAGYLGSYTSQSSLNTKLDSLKGDNYGNVSNLICSFSVDFSASQPFGWAAGCTLIANGGGNFCSQVLTGSTGVFHRQCNGGYWKPWKRLGGIDWGEIALQASGNEITVTKTFAAAPVGMVVDTDITTYTSAATNKAAYLLNQDYFRDVVSTATGSVKAKLYNKTLSISCKLTQMAYVRYLAIYD